MRAKPIRTWLASTRTNRLALAVGLVLLLIGLALLIAWLRGRDSTMSISGQRQTIQVDGLNVTMELDDTVIGSREIQVLIDDAAGNPVDIKAVRLRFSMAEMDMGALEAHARSVSRGRFRAQGSFFTMAGRWAIEAIVAREAKAPLSVAFTFPIAAPGEASGPLNPLTANQQTRAAGQLLYQANCAACHGAMGKGDGPAAIGLRPAPADFAQHMQPGKHTDGQIYLWIRDGYPQTAMPA